MSSDQQIGETKITETNPTTTGTNETVETPKAVKTKTEVPETQPETPKSVCEIAVEEFATKFLDFDCDVNDPNQKLDDYMIQAIVEAEESQRMLFEEKAAYNDKLSLEKRREIVEYRVGELDQEQLKQLQKSLLQKFKAVCKSMNDALERKQMQLSGLNTMQRLALFFIGKAHGENSDMDKNCMNLLEHNDIMQECYKNGYADVITQISSKPLTNRHLNTIQNPIMKLVDCFKKADEDSFSNDTEWMPKNGHLGTFLTICLVLLKCLRRLSQLWKTDTYDVFGDSPDAISSGVEQEMSAVIKEAYLKQSKSDPATAVDDYLVFCRIMERRVTTILQGVVLKWHQLAHKARLHCSKLAASKQNVAVRHDMCSSIKSQ
eukprot:jgi/Bigna1/129919/aug1.10_g4627